MVIVELQKVILVESALVALLNVGRSLVVYNNLVAVVPITDVIGGLGFGGGIIVFCEVPRGSYIKILRDGCLQRVGITESLVFCLYSTSTLHGRERGATANIVVIVFTCRCVSWGTRAVVHTGICSIQTIARTIDVTIVIAHVGGKCQPIGQVEINIETSTVLLGAVIGGDDYRLVIGITEAGHPTGTITGSLYVQIVLRGISRTIDEVEPVVIAKVMQVAARVGPIEVLILCHLIYKQIVLLATHGISSIAGSRLAILVQGIEPPLAIPISLVDYFTTGTVGRDIILIGGIDHGVRPIFHVGQRNHVGRGVGSYHA